MNYVHEFMLLHGSILAFTQQGLEKYNDIVTKQYFQSSNHRGQQALSQIMEKQNRLEHMRDIGIVPQKKFEMTCKNCSMKGHNRLTCTEACGQCGAKPYFSHLAMRDGKKLPVCDQEN